MKSKSNRDSTVKAVFLLTGSTYTTYALGMLVGALIARSLGPLDYGRYAYMVWLSGWLVIIANHGLNTSGIRFIAETRGRGLPDFARDVHGWLVKRQLASLVVVLAVFLAASNWMQPEQHLSRALLLSLIAVIVVSRAGYLFDTSIAKGYGAFYVEAYSTMAVGLLNAMSVVTLVFMHASLSTYLVLFTVSSAGLYVCSEIMLRRAHIVPRYQPLESVLAAQIRHHLGWTIMLVTASSLGSRSVETFLLNWLIGPVEVGYFTIATGLTRGGVDLLTVGLSTVLMPTMGRAFGEGGSARVHLIFWDSLRYFFCFGLMLAGAGAFWSSAAIELLYGSQYLNVVPVLQMMTIVGGVTLSEAAFGSLLATTGKQSVWAKISLLSLVLSAVFAFSFVPEFGLSGAVASFACTRLIAFTALVIASMRSQGITLPFAALGRLLLAAVLATCFALPFSYFLPGVVGDVLAGIVFLILYLALMIAFKAWGRSHLDLILRLTARFPRLHRWSQPLLHIWRERFTT